MLVFGDSTFDLDVKTAAGRLAACVQARAALIAAGLFEQGAWDRGDGMTWEPLRRASCEATDRAAEWLLGDQAEPYQVAARRVLAVAAEVSGTLRLKSPEGYAYYGLYPEQYRLAAELWSIDHDSQRCIPVRVVGVRSIGTSLSAIVAAALRSMGWNVRRETVRPTGHPFARKVEIAPGEPCLALVVDEGPGLSGSSMAAVAAALVRAGVPSERIAFLPAHCNGPGKAGSERVHQWWEETSIYCTDYEPFLRAALEKQTRHVLNETGPLEWIGWTGESSAVWNLLEPPRRLVRNPRGGVLWTFAGLVPGDDGRAGVEHAARVCAQSSGTTSPLVACAEGWIGQTWTPGQTCERGNGMPECIAALARHIIACAGPSMSRTGIESSVERLQRVLEHNAAEGLGKHAATVAAGWGDEVLPQLAGCVQSGDARLRPNLWAVLPDRRVIKRECPGLDEHTCVGLQPLAWAAAAAIVEWGWGPPVEERFLSFLRTRSHRPQGLCPSVLSFFKAAYAALRLGACVMGAEAESGAARERLARAADEFCAELQRLLRQREVGRVVHAQHPCAARADLHDAR